MTLMHYYKLLAVHNFGVSKPSFKLSCNDKGKYISAEVADQYAPTTFLWKTHTLMALANNFSESFNRKTKKFEVNADQMARSIVDDLEEHILLVLEDTLELKKPRESGIYHFTRDVLLDRNNHKTEQIKIVAELYNYMLSNMDFMKEGLINVHKLNVVAILTKVREIHETREKTNR